MNEMRGLLDYEDNDVTMLHAALLKVRNDGRNEGIEESINACERAWLKAHDRLPHYGDCIDEIRSLKEQQQ